MKPLAGWVCVKTSLHLGAIAKYSRVEFGFRFRIAIGENNRCEERQSQLTAGDATSAAKQTGFVHSV
ncbi:MAG: hypothetical protein MPJ50_17180 [Pirellulales bacterium]|nr:hypothetical protein [Pirellulales bacterium]